MSSWLHKSKARENEESGLKDDSVKGQASYNTEYTEKDGWMGKDNEPILFIYFCIYFFKLLRVF